MDLSKILTISGKAGLFQVVSQMKNAVLVESLIDHKRFPAFAHEKISTLQEISVFTTGEDKPLRDILKALNEKLEGKTALVGITDAKQFAAFFLEIVPDYDVERVYLSDIKKIFNWYNLLAKNELLDFTEKPEETKEEGNEAPVEGAAEATETKSKKKTTAAKPVGAPKQVKQSSQKVVKKSEHRSMNSK